MYIKNSNTRIIPSFLPILFDLLNKLTKKNMIEIITKNIKYELYVSSKYTGFIILVIPNTNNKLNIFDPIMFPIAIEEDLFFIAIIDVTNSGKDVPIAIIVSPIIFSLTLIFLANSMLLSTTKSPPIF